MIKKLQQKLKSKKGFTLIELLIVIAVLGIIAAIAIPRFSGVLGSVKDKADVRSAEIFAKEVQAELMIGSLDTVPTAGLTVTSAAPAGFDGTVPASQVTTGSFLSAKVVSNATNTQLYDIEVYRGTDKIYTLSNVSGPIK